MFIFRASSEVQINLMRKTSLMVRVISLFYAAHVVICNKENGSGEIFVGSGALVFFFFLRI